MRPPCVPLPTAPPWKSGASAPRKGEQSGRALAPVVLNPRREGSPPPRRRLRQPVRFRVILARPARNGKRQRPRQLPASPMQRVESLAAARILPGHLSHYNFRIRIHMQLLRLARYRVLQRFHQRRVLRDVVILMPNPFRDAHRSAGATADHHSNPRRPRIPQAPAVHISHQLRHHSSKRAKDAKGERLKCEEGKERGCPRSRVFCEIWEFPDPHRQTHLKIPSTLHDAPISIHRQDDYLVPFHHFATCPSAVQPL